jgi:hypothetical protein
MPGRTPRSVIVTVVLAVLVTAGALGSAGAIRWREARSASPPTTSTKTPAVGVSGCLAEPCQVLARTTVGGTSVELVADDGARSGRLRVGGPTSGTVIQATITDQGVVLTQDSLQCIAGGPAACLIKGEHDGGIAGQVVVGRSDKWSLTEDTYISDAGYLAVANINGDASPEILAAQRSGSAVFMQAFTITGNVIGCTKDYPKLDKLPGVGNVKLTETQLGPCR